MPALTVQRGWGSRVHKTDKGYRLVVRDASGQRATLRLKRFDVVTARDAHQFNMKMAMLVSARDTATVLDDDAALALRKLHPRLRKFLDRCGLLPREKTEHTLSKTMDAFMSFQRTICRESSIQVLERAQRHINAYFGSQASLASIDVAQVQGFRAFLLGKRGRGNACMSEATVRKMTSILSQVFGFAIRTGWTSVNMVKCAGLKTSVAPNPATSVLVTLAEADQLLAACHTTEERLMVGLGRFAALRIPSEVRELTWDDIDADFTTMKIKATKTGRVRIVPVFQELETLLRQAKGGSEGSANVLPMLSRHKNPSVVMRRIIKRSGVKPYPRALHSLRASCVTDWVQSYPITAVAQWAGHTTQVMAQYYLRVQSQNSALEASVAARNAAVRGFAGGAEMDIAA